VIVELSLTLSESSPVYPGVTKTAYDPDSRMSNGALNNVTYVRHFMHTGTHVDAPFHFDNDGRKMDELPITDFVYYRPLVLDLPKKSGELITPADLTPFMSRLRDADLVLFHTGFCRYQADEPRYQDEFPALNLEAARLFRDELLNVVGIGIDTLSIESVHGPEQGFAVHRMLLHHETSSNRTLLIYENVNTAPVVGRKLKTVWALPVRFAGLEAGPVAMVAEVEA
jgi:arylformamidase